MTVLCVGVDHASAPLALRERLAFATAMVDDLLAAADEGMPLVRECVLLSTCNRVELYGALDGSADNMRAGAEQMAAFLTRARGIPLADVTSALRCHEAQAAERHLCRVAAGLESVVIGEAEILGQVVDALDRAQRRGTAGDALTSLFETAIRAGKRARAETALGHNPASVSSVAVLLADDVAPRASGNRALFVGAGKMGRIGVARLCTSGRWEVTVTSRTAEHAQAMAAGRPVRVVPFDELGTAIADADVVFTATSASQPIIDRDLVQRSCAGRAIVFIDVAVPRNVHPDVGTLEGVTLYDMDHLRARVDRTLERRRGEIPAVEAIIAEELAVLGQRTRGAALLRMVHAWRRGAEEIRRGEVGQLQRAMPGLPPELLPHIEQLSITLVNRLLDEPARRLRAEASNGHAEDYAELVARVLLPGGGPRPGA
ncbi:MAG: glutamyl-tRNA reductase [Gemmatimonadaceae bacterium]